MADYRNEPVVVIGLGRFGSAIALELTRRGTEVLAIDSNPKLVQSLAGHLTQVVTADCTEIDALRQLGVGPSTAASSSSAPTSRPASWSPRSWSSSASRTSGPRPSPPSTAGSWNGSARTTSCSPRTTWASGSPTSCPAGCSTTCSSTTTSPSPRSDHHGRASGSPSANPGCGPSTGPPSSPCSRRGAVHLRLPRHHAHLRRRHPRDRTRRRRRTAGRAHLNLRCRWARPTVRRGGRRGTPPRPPPGPASPCPRS